MFLLKTSVSNLCNIDNTGPSCWFHFQCIVSVCIWEQTSLVLLWWLNQNCNPDPPKLNFFVFFLMWKTDIPVNYFCVRVLVSNQEHWIGCFREPLTHNVMRLNPKYYSYLTWLNLSSGGPLSLTGHFGVSFHNRSFWRFPSLP